MRKMFNWNVHVHFSSNSIEVLCYSSSSGTPVILPTGNSPPRHTYPRVSLAHFIDWCQEPHNQFAGEQALTTSIGKEGTREGDRC